MKSLISKLLISGAVLSAAAMGATAAQAQGPSERAQQVIDFWTPERIANAQPRGMFLDHRGKAYTKGAKGDFVPYGKNKDPHVPFAKPDGVGGGGGGGGKGGGGYQVGNAHWQNGGDIQNTAGRLLYQMQNGTGWSSYVCSGSVVTDGTTGRSIIITAAHCVYNDTAKSFARNVLFIPNQDGTTGSGTDTNCNNDPQGCWVASFGVVEQNWTNFVFPDNIPWDYAYYVVDDTGAHSGTGNFDSLESAVGGFTVSFDEPAHDDGVGSELSADFTYGMGYSYSDDPNFMYCADDMTTNGSDNWWIPICDLSGGSSGGPWIQPMDVASGSGPIVSVNSWGYTRKNLKGMAGPKLSGTTASCLFDAAKSGSLSLANNADGQQGLVVNPTSCN